MYNKNTITLNGKISTQIPGLLIQELPPISKPLLRAEKEEIDGRDGDIITPLGYSSYSKEITIGLYGNYNIDEVISYFNSEGTVIFSNEPDKYYNYQILDQIDFERLVRYKTATVTFHVQPFKYAAFEGDYILDPPADNLINIPNFTKTTNGVTLSASNDIVTITGTPTAATEFYLPIDPLALTAGTYQLSATANGTNPNNCSIRLIGSTPSNADSLGGKYIALAEGTVTLQGALSASKTFNYLWFYLNAGQAFNFTATFEVENQAQKNASGEGANIALINTSEAPFSRFDIKGNTVQQTYSGKNVLGIPDGERTANGVTFTRVNNTITCSGTLTAGTWLTMTDDTFVILDKPFSAGTYTLSISEATTKNLEMTLRDSNGVVIALTSGSTTIRAGRTSTTFTTPVEIGRYRLVCPGLTAGESLDGIAYKNIQLEAGSTATDFEPYVGGVPAPNPDNPQEIYTVKHQDMIRLTGKNLANADELYLDASITRTRRTASNNNNK